MWFLGTSQNDDEGDRTLTKILLNASNRSFRIEEPLKHKGYTVVQTPRRGNKLFKIFEFIRLTRKERPDVFLIDSSGIIFISAYIISSIFKIPFTARMRGNIWDVFEEQKTYLGFIGLMYRYILLKAGEAILRRSCRVFPVSRAIAEVLEKKGVQKENIKILHYPVDSRKFCPSEREKKGDSITMISVTNLSFRAKFGALISVLPQIDEILTEYQNLRYTIVGDGKFSYMLEDAIEKMKNSDRINYVGYHQNLEDLFAESDIFLHFSKLDGFPAAVVEAMACELPVVANKYEAMMEQVEHGVTGFFVDEESLKDAVQLLVTDEELRKKMGQQGRSYIIREFNMETVAEKFQREIEALLKDHGNATP